VLETSTAEVMTGTRYIGEWETKVKDLVARTVAPRRVVVYFTDINNVPRAGTHSQNPHAGFATYLAPYVGRGEGVLCGEAPAKALSLGLAELPGFAHLFTQIQVDAASEETTAAILRGRVEATSVARGVELVLAEDALEAVTDLAATYFPGMEQPGRSMRLLQQVLDEKLETVAADARVVDVGADDVRAGLAATTGLPDRLLSDKTPLDPAETRAFFDERVLGQAEAVSAVTDVITLVKAGLTDPQKPLAVLFFVGPTGVGKTEIAKTLAEYIFGSADRMIRVDMSEYMGADGVEKLIGRLWRRAAGAALVARVGARPFAVLLRDEVEKAHAQVFDLGLQMFDDGRLTDARGQTADFRRAIIVMTSTLASRIAEGSIGFSGGG